MLPLQWNSAVCYEHTGKTFEEIAKNAVIFHCKGKSADFYLLSCNFCDHFMENNIQQEFFQLVKQRLPIHESLVTQVADLLELSQDSAYRRIRGEKPISFEELQVLSKHFKISIDNLLHLKTTNYIFRDNSIEKENYDFNDHLDYHIQNMMQIKTARSSEIIFYSRDTAIFYFYQVPELLAFKYFYWMHTVFGDPAFSRIKFSLEDHIQKFEKKGKKAAGLFTTINSTEIWSAETLTLTLKQIQYYKEMDLFKNVSDVDVLYEKLLALIDHIELQADVGKKFLYMQSADDSSGDFTLYVNEYMLGGNNILIRSDDTWFAFINHSILNYLGTRNETYCNVLLKRIREVIKKSDLVSLTGEKLRRRFFNQLRKKVAFCRNNTFN